MRRLVTRPVTCASLSLCIAGLALALPLGAQPREYTYGMVSRLDVLPGPSVVSGGGCAYDFNWTKPATWRSSFDAWCSTPGAPARIRASASGGKVRAHAYVEALGGVPTLHSLRASAHAHIADQFTFTGVVPDSLRFHVALTGDFASRRVVASDVEAYARGYARASGSGLGVSFGTGDGVFGVDPVRSVSFVGTPQVWAGVWYMDVSLNLEATAFLRNQAGIGMGVPLGGLIGRAEADFFATAQFAYIEAFKDGVDISHRVAVTTATGAVYRFGAPTVVPEPTTLALLAGGLLGLAGAARRRRGSAATV